MLKYDREYALLCDKIRRVEMNLKLAQALNANARYELAAELDRLEADRDVLEHCLVA